MRRGTPGITTLTLGALVLWSNADDIEPISFTDWHSPEEVTKILSVFDECAPVATLYQFGETYEERPLMALKISDVSVPDPKPDLVFVGMHHAREWISVETVLYLAEHFIQELSSVTPVDAELQAALRNVDVWMIPVLNPDGYQYSYDGREEGDHDKRMWRKNRNPTPVKDIVGTDLNRNYDHWWGMGGPVTDPYTGEISFPSGSPNAADETYHGSDRESEAEVTALIEFLTDRSGDGSPIDDPRVMMSYHSYGSKIVGPWAYRAESSIKLIAGAPILEYTVHTSADTANAAVSSPVLSDPYDTDHPYVVYGDAADYFWDKHRIASFTTELPPDGSMGTSGFDPSFATVTAAQAENRSVACDLVKDVGLKKVWIRDYEGDEGAEPSSMVDETGAWDPPFWMSPDIDVTDDSVRKVRVFVNNSADSDMECELRLYGSASAFLEFPERREDALDTIDVVVPPDGDWFAFNWPFTWTFGAPSYVAVAVFHEDDRPLSNQVHMTSNMACRSVIEIELEPGTDTELELFAVNPSDGEAALEVVGGAPLTVQIGTADIRDDTKFVPQAFGELVHPSRLLRSPREDADRSRASIRIRVALEAGRQTRKEIPVSIVLRPLTDQRVMTHRRLVSGVTIVVIPK